MTEPAGQAPGAANHPAGEATHPGDDLAARLAALEAELARRERTIADLERAALDREASIDGELAVARRIQHGMIPTLPPELLGWRIATTYRPARSIGGDFYDAYPLPARPGTLGLVVADVTGKGMTAALMMAFSRAVMRSAAYNAASPADALERTNRVLVEDACTGLFLTAWLARLDGTTGEVRFAGAGHEPPLLVRPEPREVVELPSGGVLVGAFRELRATDRSVVLEAGEAIVAYTDGVTDAIDRRGRRFGDDRFREVLRAHAGEPPAGLLAAVTAAVDAWSDGVPAADDLTLVAAGRA
jgi:sigma-B regulation protein RsbU (phosphoserine phosphatase)